MDWLIALVSPEDPDGARDPRRAHEGAAKDPGRQKWLDMQQAPSPAPPGGAFSSILNAPKAPRSDLFDRPAHQHDDGYPADGNRRQANSEEWWEANPPMPPPSMPPSDLGHMPYQDDYRESVAGNGVLQIRDPHMGDNANMAVVARQPQPKKVVRRHLAAWEQDSDSDGERRKTDPAKVEGSAFMSKEETAARDESEARERSAARPVQAVNDSTIDGIVLKSYEERALGNRSSSSHVQAPSAHSQPPALTNSNGPHGGELEVFQNHAKVAGSSQNDFSRDAKEAARKNGNTFFELSTRLAWKVQKPQKGAKWIPGEEGEFKGKREVFIALEPSSRFADFDMEGELKIVDGSAAGLVFRFCGATHYSVLSMNLKEQRLEILRPYVANLPGYLPSHLVANVKVQQDHWHQLRIIAIRDGLTIFFDGVQVKQFTTYFPGERQEVHNHDGCRDGEIARAIFQDENDLETAIEAVKVAMRNTMSADWIHALTGSLLSVSTSPRIRSVLTEFGWTGMRFMGPPDLTDLLHQLKAAKDDSGAQASPQGSGDSSLAKTIVYDVTGIGRAHQAKFNVRGAACHPPRTHCNKKGECACGYWLQPPPGQVGVWAQEADVRIRNLGVTNLKEFTEQYTNHLCDIRKEKEDQSAKEREKKAQLFRSARATRVIQEIAKLKLGFIKQRMQLYLQAEEQGRQNSVRERKLMTWLAVLSLFGKINETMHEPDIWDRKTKMYLEDLEVSNPPPPPPPMKAPPTQEDEELHYKYEERRGKYKVEWEKAGKLMLGQEEFEKMNKGSKKAGEVKARVSQKCQERAEQVMSENEHQDYLQKAWRLENDWADEEIHPSQLAASIVNKAATPAERRKHSRTGKRGSGT